MDKPDLNEKIRNVLKGFYGVLKSADAHLRFVFLTGVTKFSKISIFSDLNQLEEKRKLERQRIIHSIRHKNDLEEASSACKDIAQVMAFQSDLVKIIVELNPLAVIKGT
jgi:hypothetical protein